MIDSHAHVGDEAFDADRNDVLHRCVEAGLTGIVCVGQDVDTSRRAIAMQHAGFAGLEFAASAGLHPHHAKDWEATHAALEELAERPDVFAVGETGLDFHYNYSPREEQRRSFRWHLRLASRLRKPVVVHVREAHREALDDMAAEPGALCVIHCFTGSRAEAERYLDLGAYISFSGIVTFKNAQDLRDAALCVPANRLMVETDSPLLAPVPMRGKRCEPSFVRHTLEILAKVRGSRVEEIAAATAENARAVFFAASEGAR